MEKTPILVLGKIRGVRGLRGGIRVIYKGELLFRLDKQTVLGIFTAKSLKDGFLVEPVFKQALKLIHIASLSADTAEIRLEGINDADSAYLLKGCYLGMSVEEARQKFHNPKDPYLFEYIGLAVYEGELLKGTVDRIEEFNAKQWLIVQTEAGKEVMIPLQGPYIEKIDFLENKIYLKPDNGLFEFYESF